MNICFFSIVTYWHGLRGGMENHGKLLLEGLASRGHKITVVSSKNPRGIEFEKIGNIELHYLRHTKFSSARHGWAKESYRKFLDLNKTERFDLIFAQQPIFPDIQRALRKNIPIITMIQAHEGWVMLSEINRFLNYTNDIKSIFKSVVSFFYTYLRWELYNFRVSDVIIAPAHEVADSLKKWFFINQDKVAVIYNCVDLNRFKPDETARQRIIDKYPQLLGQKTILFMSHVTPQKGLHLLIKLLPSLMASEKNISLLVVGGGSFLEEAKKLAIQLGVANQVIFAGMIDIEMLPDYINAADLFVLPTLRLEGLPLSLLEAMACKIPIITTNIGGNASVVKDGVNGILVQPGDMNSLRNNIKLLLNNKELSNHMAKNGYNIVRKDFSMDGMIDRYENLMIRQIEMKRQNNIS